VTFGWAFLARFLSELILGGSYFCPFGVNVG